MKLTLNQRRVIGVVLFALTLACLANSEFGWNWFRGFDGYITAAVGISMLVFVFRFGPTAEEIRSLRRKAKGVGLDAVEIRLHMEEEFGIEFTDSEADAIRTVGELLQAVTRRYEVRDPSRAVAYSEPSLEKIIEIVAMQLGISRDRITADSRFIEDLYR